MKLWPSSEQWDRWTLPSKAGFLGLLVGMVSVLITVSLFFLQRCSAPEGQVEQPEWSTPAIGLLLVNDSTQTASLLSRGDFVLWFPQGVETILPRLAGKYEIRAEEADEQSGLEVAVPPESELPVLVSLLDSETIGPILEKSTADLTLLLRRSDGSLIDTGSIPFTRESIDSIRWVVDLSEP